jgi:hypothetical protein
MSSRSRDSTTVQYRPSGLRTQDPLAPINQRRTPVSSSSNSLAPPRCIPCLAGPRVTEMKLQQYPPLMVVVKRGVGEVFSDP